MKKGISMTAVSKQPTINSAALLAMASEHTVGTIDEVAAVFRVHRGTVVNGIERGDLPSVRVGGRNLIPLPKLLTLLGLPIPGVAVEEPVQGGQERSGLVKAPSVAPRSGTSP